MKAGNVEGETGGGEGGGECTRTRGKSGRERRGEAQRLSDGRDKEAQRRTQERTRSRTSRHARTPRARARGSAARGKKAARCARVLLVRHGARAPLPHGLRPLGLILAALED